GCFVLGAAAVGGAAMVASDRRSAGSQLEDKNIQITASARISDLLAGRGNVGVDSYNQQVLQTGQVPTAADKQQAQDIVVAIPNVKSVANQIEVGPTESLQQQADDTVITGKVRAAFFADRALYSQAFQITTSNGVVYLQGMVTPDERKEATLKASEVSGVTKVFDLLANITPEQLQTQYRNTSQTPVTPPGSAPSVNMQQ
ncbi:MAG: BON domain-containing protein, partial [Betaproteobacteria bacterium]|nr:BON domain-containing protein [Betaproteobacteria bacterium]